MTNGATTTGARAILLDSGDTLVDEATEVRDSRGIVVRADLVPGAGDLVRELRRRGHPLALVADGRTESFRNVFGAHGLWQLFDVHAISDAVGVPKPDPRMFGCALDGLGVQPHDYRRTLMVGNHLARDIAGSNALGLQSVWLNWSPRRSKIPADESQRPRHVIREPLDLLALLEDLVE